MTDRPAMTMREIRERLGHTIAPPSPALAIHAAADRIRSVAEAALADLDTDDFWSCYDRATAWRDGFENGMGGVCSQLAALFTPELAIAFADWLDTVASHNARYGTPLPEFALTVAHRFAAPTP